MLVHHFVMYTIGPYIEDIAKLCMQLNMRKHFALAHTFAWSPLECSIRTTQYALDTSYTT